MELNNRIHRSLHLLSLATAWFAYLVTSSFGQTNVLVPTDPIIASSPDYPGSESATAAIDGTGAKYLNFDSANNAKPSGFVVTPFVGDTLVTGMTMFSANDATDRDPKDVTLEGSNDDSITAYDSGNWTLVVHLPNIPSWESVYGSYFLANRSQPETFFFPNTKTYKHYRWTVLGTQGPSTCCMHIAEVQLLGSGVLTLQTIDFGLPSRVSITNSTLTLTASASSGLPVTFLVLKGPASITGDQLTLSGVGQVIVRAWQPGNAQIHAATADLIFTAMLDGTINQSPTVSTATNFVWMNPSSSVTIAYQVGDPDSTLDVSGVQVSSPVTYILPDSSTNVVLSGGPVPAGTIGTIEATVTPEPGWVGEIPLIFVATDGYNYATNALKLNIGHVGLTIFAQPADATAIIGGRATFNVVAGSAGSVSYQWEFMGTNIPGATQASITLTNIQPSQAGPYSVAVQDSSGIVLSTAAILSVSTGTNSTITWTDPAPLTFGTPLGPTQLGAAANVQGTFTYSPAAGTVLNAGSNQVLNVTFTPLDTNTYRTASASVNITVLPATPSVTWTNPAPIFYGTPLGLNQLNASASVPGTFAYSPTNGAFLHSGTNTLAVVFTPVDSTNYSSVHGSVSLAVLFLYNGVNLSDPIQAQADLDGDGLSNLAEYALGTNPNNPADAQEGYRVSMVERGGANYLCMQFRRHRDTTAFPIHYVPEVSADGQTWFSDIAHFLPLSTNALDGQFDLVIVQDQTGTTPTAPRSVRLRLHSN